MSEKSILKKVKDKIWGYTKDYFYSQRVKDSPLVQNINYDSLISQKNALLCYLPHSYFQTLQRKTIGRTIPFEIFKIVKLLSEYGYCIDIISANDLLALEIVRSKTYDLIFGFGDTFFKITQLQPNALSIFYMTENHPAISYREEKKRIDYFYDRHKIRASMERSGRFYKKEHMEIKYDHIIALGETAPFRDQYEKPYSVFPTGILNPNFIFTPKNYFSARKHFLWLGSPAVIHKGLDLLIDVFRSREDITLHICGLDQKSRKLLSVPEKRNIIDYGFVQINSETFLKIVDVCSFSILPSCSEGMATSITTSMLHGLIPIVIRDTGFNRLDDHAIFLDDYKTEYLNDILSKLIEYDPKKLEAMASEIHDFASRNFNIMAYEKTMRSIFQEIIK